MNQLDLSAEFQDALNAAADRLKSWVNSGEIIRVSSHIDADGLAAAGILSSMLLRMKANFHVRILPQLEPNYIEDLAKEKRKYYIFSDFGSGQVNLLTKSFPKEEIILLDHHEPLKSSEKSSNILELNSHLYKINGSNDISAAGMCFLFAYAVDSGKNLDLLPLALVGAVGDTQDNDKQHSFTGVNKKLAELGVEQNLIKIEKDLYFQYRELRPIHEALMETSEPYLPELTGNEAACLRFLANIGIPLHAGENPRTISDLSTNEKKILTSQLSQLILSHDGTSEQANSLVSTNYSIIHEKESYLKDIREFSQLLNACGRTRNPGIGVAVCIGDRDIHYKHAQDLLLNYSKKVNSFLDSLKRHNKIQETDYIQFFYGEDLDETMIGTITTIATKTKIANKVLIGFASCEDGSYKISARTQDALVNKGVHLGHALRETITKLGLDPSKFIAGGHDAAAGTRIPKSYDKLFIETLNKVVAEQISKKR
ncbi:MAG: DHH family phosphoesterase [Candidatus Helarchaeota archaeon]|nr:DHH family phosphoesterase [Candidatus Helarchaeota archaeon]